MTDYPTISTQLSDAAASRADGRRAIDWARNHMPILSVLRDRFVEETPFDGYAIGMAMHVEAKTAVLVETLAAGGATVVLTGCNPLSTHDDVSAALDSHEAISSYAKHGVDEREYYEAIRAVISHEPEITIDDGGDLVFAIHEEYPSLIENIIGGCEETTTGINRLRAMETDGALQYPMYAVNDTPMKRLFDNVHGTGESSLTSIAMTTNLSFAGKTIVVAGYGFCGSGIARKASGLNARVIVTEVEPRRALEAHMDGFTVMPMRDAASKGDIFITTTGNRDVIRRSHFEKMSDGVVLANAGHFNVEIDIDGLADMAVERNPARDGVETFLLESGHRINVLADGRLVNLATPVSLGHPVEVMDQSFGVQVMCVREIITHGDDLAPGVHQVPDDLDREIAEIKLGSVDVEIDELTSTQASYLSSWEHGT